MTDDEDAWPEDAFDGITAGDLSAAESGVPLPRALTALEVDLLRRHRESMDAARNSPRSKRIMAFMQAYRNSPDPAERAFAKTVGAMGVSKSDFLAFVREAKKKRGRPVGTGYAEDDAPLVREVQRLVAEGSTLASAAAKVAPLASGTVEVANRAKRIARKVTRDK